MRILQKKPARPTTTQEKVSWTKEEEEKLAEAWISASQDLIKGYSQTYGICNNLLNIRKSRSNDFDVFKVTLDQFENITPTHKAFLYVKVWLKLKDVPKWKEQMERSSQSSGAKHSRNPDATSQQSNGRTHFDINDDPLDLEDEQPLRRPVGKNKARKRL
uniref:No apical meristem-associated C-terminal domain-containing protein n=1 Tax=Lactuca sativa TaxID=4236 RepID=A0A9R1WA44_LACSA|nr:hypothetical protein LSAT_V11C300102980 [Lactuca sativa]